MPEKFENIFHKQSPLLHEQTGKSSLDKHIYYLENISPYDLLKDKIHPNAEGAKMMANKMYDLLMQEKEK